MATVAYTFVSRCSGGCHNVFDISVNGGADQRITYNIDEIREPLSALTPQQISELKLMVLKVHMSGKTRAQIVTELQSGPVTVTI